MSQPADYYGTGHAWDKVVAAVQHCAPVQPDSPDFVWVIYADVKESCDEPHELGRGGLASLFCRPPRVTLLQESSTTVTRGRMSELLEA